MQDLFLFLISSIVPHFCPLTLLPLSLFFIYSYLSFFIILVLTVFSLLSLFVFSLSDPCFSLCSFHPLILIFTFYTFCIIYSYISLVCPCFVFFLNSLFPASFNPFTFFSQLFLTPVLSSTLFLPSGFASFNSSLINFSNTSSFLHVFLKYLFTLSPLPLCFSSLFLTPCPFLFAYQWEDREQEPDDEAGDQFDYPVPSSPAWEAVVPQCCQQLLAIRLCHKLNRERQRQGLLKCRFIELMRVI